MDTTNPHPSILDNPNPNILENPTRESAKGFGFCAVRKRKADGTSNVGGTWLEPLGSSWTFIDDQKTWEVVFYKGGHSKDLPK